MTKLNNVNFSGMNLTAEDRQKIQPFIDWLIDSKKVSKATQLYLDMAWLCVVVELRI